jgi:hypothetical protein
MKEPLHVPPESDSERQVRELLSALVYAARGLRGAVGAVIGYLFLVVVTFGLLVDGDTLGRITMATKRRRSHRPVQ